MDERTRSYLLQNRQALERDIKTSYIMDHMVADGTLAVMEEEKVKAQVIKGFYPFVYVRIEILLIYSFRTEGHEGDLRPHVAAPRFLIWIPGLYVTLEQIFLYTRDSDDTRAEKY